MLCRSRCKSLWLLLLGGGLALPVQAQTLNQTTTSSPPPPAASSASGPAVQLNTPSGGWNYGGLTDHAGRDAAAYPYSPIDRGQQRNRRLIEGFLAGVGKNRRPGTLIVNGNAMRLYTDETEGRYARPFAFGRGSNSVEVRSPDGKTRKRVQFYENNQGQAQAKIRVICVWDDSQAEVDMHIITPDGQHASFASPLLTTGGGLDVDSVDGAGPEMFSTIDPIKGAYHVYVNYWGNFGTSGYHFDEKTRQKPVITTQITLVFHENTPHEKRETLVVPLRRIGDLTHVKSFIY